MSKYIFCISPVLDSIALRYPEIENPTLTSAWVEDLKNTSSGTYEELDLFEKEDTDKIQAAWIKFGIGQIEFAKDKTLYIKVPFDLIEQYMKNTLNRLQEFVKSLKYLELANSKARLEIEEILYNLNDNFMGVEIINFAEAIEPMSLAQWIYSEYERIYTSEAYRKTADEMKELNDLIIVYELHQVFVD